MGISNRLLTKESTSQKVRAEKNCVGLIKRSGSTRTLVLVDQLPCFLIHPTGLYGNIEKFQIRNLFNSAILIILLTFLCVWVEPIAGSEAEVEDDETILIEDEAAPADITIEDEATEPDSITIEDDGTQGESDEIIIDTEDSPQEMEQGVHPETSTVETGDKGKLRIAMDAFWLEYGAITRSSETADDTGYGHAAFSAAWDSGADWDARLAGRIDGYLQGGEPDFDHIDIDYGESYLRYRSDKLRITLGTQTLIWGRIDELPPIDRLSVQDLTRFILDDLPDRRRSTPMIRFEGFFENNKLDLIWKPVFREAELPQKESIWYPVDQREGKILGVETSELLSAAVRSVGIDDDAPDGDGGFGLRFSRTQSMFDFALTLQHGRQSTPYFRFNSVKNRLEAQYPRAWSIGADAALEAMGATWRFEAAWVSDMPVTRNDLRFTTVKGINWAAGVEFHPGDGDTRVNLQLVGINLYSTPEILDRKEVYNFNGAIETPFDQERWRAKMRFFLGLDKKDIYLNPSIAYIGWEPHELFLEYHYFTGSDGTIGGFHQDHSLVTLGWRARF